MKFAAAPILGSDIGDGFGEIPTVAVKILNVVLALAIGVFFGFGQDHGAVLSRALAMAVRVFNANLNRLRMVGHNFSFGDGEAAIPGLHLDAVIGDAKADPEAEGLREPIGSRGGVRVNKNGDDGAGRNRSVGTHGETLSPAVHGRVVP